MISKTMIRRDKVLKVTLEIGEAESLYSELNPISGKVDSNVIRFTDALEKFIQAYEEINEEVDEEEEDEEEEEEVNLNKKKRRR